MNCWNFLWQDPAPPAQSARARMSASLKDKLGVADLKDKQGLIWKACAAELVGNLLLNFFGCASVMKINEPASSTDLVRISLTFGLTIFVAAQAFCHVSGAHLNPAVSVAMLLCGKVSVVRSILYICAQCVGAICGTGILKAMTPNNQTIQGKFGLTLVNSELSPLQGLGVEFLLGFILVLVVFSVCDPNRNPIGMYPPLAIGMAVAVGHLAAVELTGASMNPARTLGSAVIANVWDNHWIYWLGPILGGSAAAALYQYVFAAKSEEYVPVNVAEEREMQSIDQKSP